MPHLNPLHHEKPAHHVGAEQPIQHQPQVAPETSSLHQQGTLVDGAHPQQVKHHRVGFFEGMTFRKWIQLHWVDILTMAALGAVALGVYKAPPAPSRSFAIDFQDGESEFSSPRNEQFGADLFAPTVVYPQFAYPLRNEIVRMEICISGQRVLAGQPRTAAEPAAVSRSLLTLHLTTDSNLGRRDDCLLCACYLLRDRSDSREKLPQ